MFKDPMLIFDVLIDRIVYFKEKSSVMAYGTIKGVETYSTAIDDGRLESSEVLGFDSLNL